MGYYNAINIGEVNYYMALEDKDITSWVECFCKGMEISFKRVRKKVESDMIDTEIEGKSKLLYELDVRQKKLHKLFEERDIY